MYQFEIHRNYREANIEGGDKYQDNLDFYSWLGDNKYLDTPSDIYEREATLCQVFYPRSIFLECVGKCGVIG